MSATIRLPASLKHEILTHLRGELPNEAWGLLSGSEGQITNLQPMTNVATSPTAFGADPQELYRALKGIEERREELLCIYHSHPSTGAYFSERDRAMACPKGLDGPAYPGVAYIVVGMADPNQPEWRAFTIEHGEAREAELTFEPAPRNAER